jgi:hypothetical protein
LEASNDNNNHNETIRVAPAAPTPTILIAATFSLETKISPSAAMRGMKIIRVSIFFPVT